MKMRSWGQVLFNGKKGSEHGKRQSYRLRLQKRLTFEGEEDKGIEEREDVRGVMKVGRPTESAVTRQKAMSR